MPAHILRMKSVNILQRRDRIEHASGIDALRQRQLDEDAMHCRIDIELIDQREQLVGRRCVREAMQPAGESILLASFLLIANIDLTGRIFADKHGGKTRLDARGLRELAHLQGNLAADFVG